MWRKWAEEGGRCKDPPPHYIGWGWWRDCPAIQASKGLSTRRARAGSARTENLNLPDFPTLGRGTTCMEDSAWSDEQQFLTWWRDRYGRVSQAWYSQLGLELPLSSFLTPPSTMILEGKLHPTHPVPTIDSGMGLPRPGAQYLPPEWMQSEWASSLLCVWRHWAISWPRDSWREFSQDHQKLHSRLT